MIKVLIADDHAVVRSGLKCLFEQMGDILVTGEATNSNEVLEAAQNGEFDLILLDLTMPGISGSSLIEQLVALNIKAPILVFSMHDELSIATRMRQAGARGYVTKGSEHKVLIEAVRKVAAGGNFIDPYFTAQMIFTNTSIGDIEPHKHLSERQLNVFKLFANGMGISEIADELSISIKTVSNHKTRLMQKMNFQSNVEIIRYAIDHKLIE